MADTQINHSTFLALPSEIRLTIYKLFFSGQPRSISNPFIRPISFVDEQHWNLLLVSKDIYHEAMPQYYRTCMFALYTLNQAHVRKLIKDMGDTNFSRYATNLLVWKVPEANLFEGMREVRWVKLLGIACGVESDEAQGQVFTYDTLMMALRKSRVPGFSWSSCLDLFSTLKNINFMVDLRCDYWETKFDSDGHPRRKWIRTNFVYDVREDTFVEQTFHASRENGLVLRR